MIRVGLGYDSHRFDPEVPMILGGVEIPGSPGLSGFSDGDAVAHAVTDAILGAAGAGDIGRHFPPGDERWRDADSIDLLRRATAVIHGQGWTVGNVDVTIVCEHPKVAPWAARMGERLAEALSVPSSVVSVKGKTNEGMGWIGRGEGVAVHAVALLEGGPDTG